MLNQGIKKKEFGVFPRWPHDGDGWIHPDDVELTRSLIPSDRVLCKWSFEGDYNVFRYGATTIRLLPAMWLTIPDDVLFVGDFVQVRSLGGKNFPGVARIREMTWNYRKRHIEYLLTRRNMHLDTVYLFNDLELLDWMPLPEFEAAPHIEMPDARTGVYRVI